MEDSGPLYAYRNLLDFACLLLERAGLANDKAAVVDEILLEGDLMGHTTHGLQLLAPYLEELEKGTMTKKGEPDILMDRGTAVTWDGRYLPGPWLVIKAMDLAFERVKEHPVVTVVIGCSHHIASLASYPKRATDRGLIFLLTCSDPSNRSVAPFGGTAPLYTPNPMAAGFPTEGEPVIMDISTSCTANGMTSRLYKENRRLPHPWLLDSQGNLSDDPAVLFSDHPGTILPLGGADLGYKGYALGILVEALTSALSGLGRADNCNQWGSSVFMQIIDPEGFGSKQRFIRESEWLARACRSNPVKPGASPVRLPGNRALYLRAEQLKKGVRLYPAIMPSIKPWAKKYCITMPGEVNYRKTAGSQSEKIK